jgi:hypothetical protein
MNTATTTGTIDWSMRTGGHLDAAERRRLVADLAACRFAALSAA